MNPLSALRDFFSGRVDGAAPIDDSFVQIDREAAVEQLRLPQRGAELGKQELPPSDAVSLDVVETDIVAAVKDHLNRAQIDAANNVRTYEQRLSELHLLHELAAIKSAALKALGDFHAQVIVWNNRLANRRDAIADSYTEIRSFKADNGLNRPFHEVPSLVVPFSTIAFAWLIETLGNSFFLRVNDEMGWVGGVFAAAIIAFINVLTSVLAGKWLFPRTNFPPGPRRYSAYAGVAAWLIFLLVWNMVAAHYRDAKSSGVATPETAAIALTWDAPLHLESIYSWGLFIIGLLAALVSAKGGYGMDDPYPGYGDIGRRHKERCEDYADEVSQATEELSSIRDEAFEEAQSVKRELGVQFRERRRIVAGHATFRRRFMQHQDHLEQTANTLLSVYRHANREARSTPAPRHFDDRWTFSRSELPELHEEPIREEDIKGAEEALDRAIDQIAAAFEKSIRSFKPLDELKQELSRGEI
ncbi:MAG TPA: hypothetical protein VF574_12160 [Allosphingosinicella sp.]